MGIHSRRGFATAAITSAMIGLSGASGATPAETQPVHQPAGPTTRGRITRRVGRRRPRHAAGGHGVPAQSGWDFMSSPADPSHGEVSVGAAGGAEQSIEHSLGALGLHRWRSRGVRGSQSPQVDNIAVGRHGSGGFLPGDLAALPTPPAPAGTAVRIRGPWPRPGRLETGFGNHSGHGEGPGAEIARSEDRHARPEPPEPLDNRPRPSDPGHPTTPFAHPRVERSPASAASRELPAQADRAAHTGRHVGADAGPTASDAPQIGCGSCQASTLPA